MGIELQKAKEKLDMIEKLANNPELILTDLYSEGLSDSNFIYQINVKGKYILEYLTDYLKKQSVFNGAIIKLEYRKLNIYIPALKHGDFQEFQSDDKIMEIDIEKRAYVLCDDFLNKYKRVMDANYNLEVCELSDFWKQFEDLSLKSRIKNAFKELTSKHKLSVKLSNFLFFFIVREKMIQASLNKEKRRIDDKNKYNANTYNSNIELQKIYNEKAPDQIEKCLAKQKDLEQYFSRLGYKEDCSMDKY